MTAARAVEHLVPVLCSQCRQTTLEPLGDGLPTDLAQRLTPTERRLFTVLQASPEPLRTRDLVPLVWGPEYVGPAGTRLATVALSRFRAKLTSQRLGWRLAAFGPFHWRTFRVVVAAPGDHRA